MLYRAPTLDFLSMLIPPLSFQVVEFFHALIGFIWIRGFILAMVGLFLFGMSGRRDLLWYSPAAGQVF